MPGVCLRYSSTTRTKQIQLPITFFQITITDGNCVMPASKTTTAPDGVTMDRPTNEPTHWWDDPPTNRSDRPTNGPTAVKQIISRVNRNRQKEVSPAVLSCRVEEHLEEPVAFPGAVRLRTVLNQQAFVTGLVATEDHPLASNRVQMSQNPVTTRFQGSWNCSSVRSRRQTWAGPCCLPPAF